MKLPALPSFFCLCIFLCVQYGLQDQVGTAHQTDGRILTRFIVPGRLRDQAGLKYPGSDKVLNAVVLPMHTETNEIRNDKESLGHISETSPVTAF